MLKLLIENQIGNCSNQPNSSSISDNSDYLIKGKNVMRMPASGANNFAFQLLDMMFDKEELCKSLMYATKKSEKPGLDQTKVARLLFLVDKRYGHKDDWDEKTLIKKLNQKCRDSAPKKVKEEPGVIRSEPVVVQPEEVVDRSSTLPDFSLPMPLNYDLGVQSDSQSSSDSESD